MIPLAGETFHEWWEDTDWAQARDAYHASIGLAPHDRSNDVAIYYHDLTAGLRAEAASRAWQDQASAVLDEPWPLAAWPDVPTRVLAGRHDRMFPLELQRRIARERLHAEIEEVAGGHMVALSHPGGLADILERCVVSM